MIERTERETHTVLRMTHGKANAMDTPFLLELARTLENEERSDARSVVITGNGSIFSAGIDLFQLTERGRGYIETLLPALSTFLTRLFAMSKPVVAAINGHAIAGGCLIACASDHRIMARGRGKIGVPELLVGVPFPPIALEIMRYALPTHRLHEAVYGGGTYGPEEALERGFVDEVVEDGLLLERAAEVAARLAAIPRGSFRMTKAWLRGPALERCERLGPGAAAELLEAWAGIQTQRAVRDYIERTLAPKRV